MRRLPGVALIVLAFLAGASCGGQRQVVMVPPRIDLEPHQLIGVIQFDTTSEGELAPLVTRRFIEAMRRDQGVVRVVDLGTETEVLASVGHDRLDRAAYQALGQKQDLRTIVTGRLTVSDVRPGVRISPNLRSGSLSARVEAALEVQLVEASTGASIWSASARANRDVGHVSVLGGKDIVFDAEDPEAAYGSLVDGLVEQVTQDFHVGWERR